MHIFTGIQTKVLPSVGNLPRRDVKEWDNNSTYSSFVEVALYNYNGTPYNNIYVSLQDNNVGNNPLALGEWWEYKEKIALFRPVQPIPTTSVLRDSEFSYGIGCVDADFLFLFGLVGQKFKIEELDSTDNVLSSNTYTIYSNTIKYLHQINNVSSEERIRITITPNSGEMCGILLVRGMKDNDLGTDMVKCKRCDTERIYVKQQSSYADDGIRLDGSGVIVEDKKVIMTVDKTKKDDLKALLSELVDTPVFVVKDISSREKVNEGIYGFYSQIDLEENCKTGNYSFSGSVQSYPYYPPTTLKDEICKPEIYDCLKNSTPTDKQRGVTIWSSDFCYNSPKPKSHHSTDWVLKDSSGAIVDSLPMRTGEQKYLYVKKLDPATYTVECTYRDTEGKMSQTASKSVTVPDDCYTVCPNIFRDNSMRFHIPLDESSSPHKEIFNNGNWNEKNAGDLIHVHLNANCYGTYCNDDGYIEGDVSTVPYRFGKTENIEMTMSFFGYFMSSSSFCFPYIIRFGGFAVAMCPKNNSSIQNCVCWLESNTKQGISSPMLDLEYETQSALDHYVFYVNIMTRVVKFYVNGELKKEFYNISNDGTDNSFDNPYYRLGEPSGSSCSGSYKKRGVVRNLCVFNRELTLDEMYQLQRSEKDV